METVKTAVIVLLLMAVLYGVYVVLNQPEVQPPSEEIAWHQQQSSEPLQIDFGDNTAEPMPPSHAGAPAPPAASEVATPRLPELPAVEASPLPAATVPETSVPVPPPFAGGEAALPSSGAELPVPSADVPPTAAAESPWPALPAVPREDTSSSAAPWSRADGSSENAATTAASPPADNAAQTGSADTATTRPSVYSDTAQSASRSNDTSVPETGREVSSLSGGAGSAEFDRAMASAHSHMAAGQWYDALFTLSMQYRNPDLTADQRQRLLDTLDPLAGKVIYSTEHLIEPGYEVRRGETLIEIAQRFNVPWQLLANINGVSHPDNLPPGSQLKVIPGPFHAEVDLTGRELTLFVGRLYAGRFPITVGADPSPPAGEYRVNDKQPGHTYYAGDGRTIASDDPQNPYGQIWIDLGGDVCLHGSPRADASDRLGCISLSPADANDLFGILSKGSPVVIRR